jgi:ribonucleoside-diphosphate reductase alpha chain
VALSSQTHVLEIEEVTVVPKSTDLSQTKDHEVAEGSDLIAAALPVRSRLPDLRQSVTHKFNVSGYEGYLIVGRFDDGRPGELFIKIAKQGSTMAGFANSIGILTSLALQYGVPVDALARKFEDMRFEPSGSTKNAEIRHADSLAAYIFRWMGLTFSPAYREGKHATEESD